MNSPPAKETESRFTLNMSSEFSMSLRRKTRFSQPGLRENGRGSGTPGIDGRYAGSGASDADAGAPAQWAGVDRSRRLPAGTFDAADHHARADEGLQSLHAQSGAQRSRQ